MMPGMNPRQMKKMMQQMGMQMDELDADEVIIKMRSGDDIVITDPNVVKMKVQGQESFQITGNVSSEGEGDNVIVEISDDDIKMVAEQAKVTEAQAKEALEQNQGDLAKTILDLTQEETLGTAE